MTEQQKPCRSAFEREISSPPYEKETTRWPDAGEHAWPGQYRDYEVELAWCMFQAAWNMRNQAEAIKDGWDAGAYKAACDELEAWKTRALDAEACSDRLRLEIGPSHMGEPFISPLAGKYAEVLWPFVGMMNRELHANAGKGDRPGWLTMDRKTALLEIFYHLAKLQRATRDNDINGIQEYAADVANMSMMLVDVCGALSPLFGESA